jgi:hypothetical protein
MSSPRRSTGTAQAYTGSQLKNKILHHRYPGVPRIPLAILVTFIIQEIITKLALVFGRFCGLTPKLEASQQLKKKKSKQRFLTGDVFLDSLFQS